ncbi:MAG: hypothetical protein WCO16_02155 [bacterium]
MKDIKELISKLTGIRDPKENKDIVIKILKDVCGIDIIAKNIDFSNDSLKLNISGPEKNAIFISQQKILTLLQERITDRKITRIN